MNAPWHGGQFVRNGILRSLSRLEFERIRPFLRSVTLNERAVLQETNKLVEYVYFIETGVVSLMTIAAVSILETAMVGSNGIVPASIALGANIASHRSMVLVPGNALRIRTDDLQRAMHEYPQIREHLFRYVHSLMVHGAQTALCGVQHHLEQRLAYWLCLVCDSLKDDVLPITHKHLANVLGCRRAGVTDALAVFEEQGLLQKTRGALQIFDRNRLEGKACCCYGIVANAYKPTIKMDSHKSELKITDQLVQKV